MQRLLVTTITFLLLAACAPLGAGPTGTPGIQAPSLAPAITATSGESPATTLTPPALPTSNPTQAAGAVPTANPTLAATTAPTTGPGQTPGSGAAQPGWKTYSDPQAGFQMDYPAEWTVADQKGVIHFWLAPGVPISLAPVNTGKLSPQAYIANADMPNVHCTQQASRFGMAYSHCFDTIARTQFAQFTTKNSQGIDRLFTLSLERNGDLPVFTSMIDSLRAMK